MGVRYTRSVGQKSEGASKVNPVFTFNDHGTETRFALSSICYVQDYPTRLEVITKNAPTNFEGELEPICIPRAEAERFNQAWAVYLGAESEARIEPAECLVS